MIKVTTCKVSSNRIGSGSGDKTPSPDWDVKRPDGDGKEGWEGFDEAKGL